MSVTVDQSCDHVERRVTSQSPLRETCLSCSREREFENPDRDDGGWGSWCLAGESAVAEVAEPGATVSGSARRGRTGRPPDLGVGRSRTESVRVSLTPAEKARVVEMSRARGTPMGTIAREALLLELRRRHF